MTLNTHWYGPTEYHSSLQIMDASAESARTSGALTLLGFEYDTLITLGRRAHGQLEILSASESVPVINVPRGGLATLHNRGQCVIYPVVPLKKQQLFAREWVNILTTVTKNTLEKCNIIVNSTNNGVFTPIGKIASIGIDIKGGVSTHGIAINISNNLSEFSRIIPCGIANQIFDRVSDHKTVSPEDFFKLWSAEFLDCFAPYTRRSLTNTSTALSF